MYSKGFKIALFLALSNFSFCGDYIVETNGKLTLKAGDEIVLKNGVHFKAGSTVHIKQEYDECNDFKSGGSAGLNGASNAENERYESAKYFTSNEASRQSLAIYPNPSSGKFTIEAQQQRNIVSIEVYAMNGTLQFSEQNIHKQSITLETTLDKGAYLVVTKLEDETMRNKIIVFGFGKFGMLVFLLVLLGSCKKLNKIQVVGKVVNPITGEGIEGVKMSVITTTGGLPAGETTITSTITDLDGNYALDGKKMKAVYLQINTFGNYHPIGWYVNGSYSGGNMFPVEKGKTMHVDFHAVPYGGAILDIENINCLGSNDTMQFRRKYQFDSAFPENWSTYRIGCYSYISPEPFNLPMGYHYYESKVTRNGITFFFYDTVYVNNIGVSTVEIRY